MEQIEQTATVASIEVKHLEVSGSRIARVELSNGTHWNCRPDDAPAATARFIVTTRMVQEDPLPFTASEIGEARGVCRELGATR